jgi:membrane carboxypeptidase/penicillin-binding protein
MKILLSYLTTIIILISSNFAAAQSDDKLIVSMLREFYTAYNNAWSNTSGYNLVKKLDSLQQKYCSHSLKNKLKENYKLHGLDHDILINNYYADAELLRTLTIKKALNKTDSYIISYVANSEDPFDSNENKITVILLVTVVKESGVYKINSVKPHKP